MIKNCAHHDLANTCHDAILILRPIVSDICARSLPFYGSICGLKGAARPPQMVPRAFITVGRRLLAVPFCYVKTSKKNTYNLGNFNNGWLVTTGYCIGWSKFHWNRLLHFIRASTDI